MKVNLGWRHIQALLLCLGLGIAYTLRVCMSVAVIAMRNSSGDKDIPTYHWGPSLYNMILSSFFWSYVVMQIPAGYLIQNRSQVKILALSIFSSSVFNMLIPWLASYGYIAVIFGRVCMGFSQSCTVICVTSLMSRWIPTKEKARLGSLINNGVNVGTIVGMLMSGYLASTRFGWPSIFYYFGICGIIWSILFYFLSADYPSEHAYIGSKEVQLIESSVSVQNDSLEGKKLKLPWLDMITSKPLWALAIASCGHFWGYYLFFNQLPTYMKYILKFDLTQSGAMSALPYIASLLLSLPISIIADYALKKGATTETVRKVCATIALWTPCICLIVLGSNITTNKAVVVGVLVLSVGSGSATYCSLLINIIDLVCSNFVATVISYINALIGLVSVLSPLLFGLMVTDTTNLYHWQTIFYITAGIYFISNVVFMIFGKAEIQTWNNPDENLKNTNPS